MSDDTMDKVRSEQVQILKMGLMRYVARTPLYREVDISHSAQLVQEEVVDQWNNWLFELDFSPSFEGEETYKEFSMESSFTVLKITENWKRYHIEMTLQKSNVTASSLTALGFYFNQPGTYWIDGIQVEKGKLTDYEPSGPIEVGAVCKRLYPFYKKGENKMAKTQLEKALKLNTTFSGSEEAREVLSKL